MLQIKLNILTTFLPLKNNISLLDVSSKNEVGLEEGVL